MKEAIILGAGMTGLAAGAASGFDVFEGTERPGGICSSYYMRPGKSALQSQRSKKNDDYRFELGGGHWIFGGDPMVLALIGSLTRVERHGRKSSVFLPSQGLFIPYPIQNHLHALGDPEARRIADEIVELSLKPKKPSGTMAEWLENNFGPTLCELFFTPFHALYTAGLWKEIAPQDDYKSPVDVRLVQQGATTAVPQVGYNVHFIYPEEGLDKLAHHLAARCKIFYKKRAKKIDLAKHEVQFEGGKKEKYRSLLSTLPLNQIIQMSGLKLDVQEDPASSVLVVNIGALKGKKCPPDHWVYLPSSRAGFHRVGFYSNVDEKFYAKDREAQNRVSIYVEKAYPYAQKPTAQEIRALEKTVVDELKEWGWIKEADVVHSTWVEVAYTWSRPKSSWKGTALKELEKHRVFSIGRYGRWVFQGIADSLRDGFVAGAALKHMGKI